MISYLRGKIALKEIDSIILDVNGVGYGVAMSPTEHSVVAQGTETKLFIYEHIREDAHDLYGFLSETSKGLFTQLISVKNVGPKVALAVLSLGNEGTIRSAIANGNVKLLQSAKGVGKRAAEQMVVELRDKVGLSSSSEAESIVNRSGVDSNDEAVQGLIALGYNEIDAVRSLQGVDKSLKTEDRIKAALKGNS
jgi:holliday junction DNA helicase RuvA